MPHNTKRYFHSNAKNKNLNLSNVALPCLITASAHSNIVWIVVCGKVEEADFHNHEVSRLGRAYIFSYFSNLIKELHIIFFTTMFSHLHFWDLFIVVMFHFCFPFLTAKWIFSCETITFLSWAFIQYILFTLICNRMFYRLNWTAFSFHFSTFARYARVFLTLGLFVVSMTFLYSRWISKGLTIVFRSISSMNC